MRMCLGASSFFFESIASLRRWNFLFYTFTYTAYIVIVTCCKPVVCIGVSGDVCRTDSQSLSKSPVPVKVQLGEEVMGGGTGAYLCGQI